MKNIGKMITALALFALILTSCAPAATPTAAPATSAPATAAPATVAPATAAPATAAPTANQAPVHLVVWWWGEQEAPGAQKWMDETVANYEKLHPNVTIETVLQSTDSPRQPSPARISSTSGVEPIPWSLLGKGL